ncbi:hypothetical protein FDUTEX481_09739 [Tolypothrix sp. PCC 7601]|nr:hypothetical protein FDUTEX481_09739 [Tolypothrix sp. PCC 7601]
MGDAPGKVPADQMPAAVLCLDPFGECDGHDQNCIAKGCAARN